MLSMSASGDACRFCHCPHPPRRVPLGKRHRQVSEAMAAAECFGILLPVLERKMITLRLATDTLRLLAGQLCAGLGGAPVDAGSKARELRTIENAFGAMSMRSLLVVLQRKMGPQRSREKALLDTLFLELREAGFIVDFGSVGQGDA
ncbi:unnamed protein product [Prorocentrum cordatum]|uniref:Uncharacterized protein n=1 Tax=Prorocentrum cordatum TaxID=2364126 RepID=A0ABN9XC73_9DINO|nr:unnamed protein product [Polarella glacialis]